MRFAAAILFALPLLAAEWPQFRGVNANGLAESSAVLSADFGPSKNVVWKTSLPAGKSSPIVSGNRIFLTAHEGDKLLTFALDRATGAVLWRQEITRARTEKRHKLNDAAAPTPVTDGKNVYTFFADFGLAAYTVQGKPLWTLPLSAMPSMQGVASSPMLAGGKLILVVDQAQDSYQIAVNPNNGETLWRKERAPASGGTYCSPVLMDENMFVTFSPFELAGFSVSTGEKLWWVTGLPPQPKSTPLIVNGVIYTFSRSFYGDSVPPIPAFGAALEQNDKNKDGFITKDEAPDGPAKTYFAIVDRNKDGKIDASEWAEMIAAASPKSMLLAVKPQGRGDLTAKAVLWKVFRTIPDVPMPLLYNNVLYTIQNGGILSAINPATGEILKQGRLTGALGDYYSSPLASNGLLLLANQEGKFSVVRAGKDWELLKVNDLEEEVFASPALLGDELYIRTARNLYRFKP